MNEVYISNLVASGASVKTCQVLARHSTATLTFDAYARASLHDLSGAVESLPDLGPEPARHSAMAATGTAGRAAHGKRAADGTGRPPSHPMARA